MATPEGFVRADTPHGFARAGTPQGFARADSPHGFVRAESPNGNGCANTPTVLSYAETPRGFGCASTPNGYTSAGSPQTFARVDTADGFPCAHCWQVMDLIMCDECCRGIQDLIDQDLQASAATHENLDGMEEFGACTENREPCWEENRVLKVENTELSNKIRRLTAAADPVPWNYPNEIHYLRRDNKILEIKARFNRKGELALKDRLEEKDTAIRDLEDRNRRLLLANNSSDAQIKQLSQDYNLDIEVKRLTIELEYEKQRREVCEVVMSNQVGLQEDASSRCKDLRERLTSVEENLKKRTRGLEKKLREQKEIFDAQRRKVKEQSARIKELEAKLGKGRTALVSELERYQRRWAQLSAFMGEEAPQNNKSYSEIPMVKDMPISGTNPADEDHKEAERWAGC